MAISLDDHGGNLKIWLLNYEGGVGQPVFAPLGSRLAIESLPASGYARLVIIDTVNFSVSEPSWASDGNRLAAIASTGPPGAGEVASCSFSELMAAFRHA